MKYVLRVNITSDGDFYYDSKWIQFREDYRDNTWFFDTREEAVKALKECYDEIIESFSTSRDYIMKIKNKLVFFRPYMDICLSKFKTLYLSLDYGNQEMYFTLGAYDEIKKELDWDMSLDIDPEAYDWEKISKLKGIN